MSSGSTWRSLMADPRIVYGATCSWWDSIDKVAKKPSGLPSCPNCGGVLFEVSSEKVWWADVDRHDRERDPGYRQFIEWSRGKCFPDHSAAQIAYAGAL